MDKLGPSPTIVERAQCNGFYCSLLNNLNNLFWSGCCLQLVGNGQFIIRGCLKIALKWCCWVLFTVADGTCSEIAEMQSEACLQFSGRPLSYPVDGSSVLNDAQ